MTKKALYAFIFSFLTSIGFFLWWQFAPNDLKKPPALTLPFSATLSPRPPSPSPLPHWTLIATGDVLTARTVNKRTLEADDFRWPWLYTADALRQADLTFINLETPLTAQCRVREGGFSFCGDTRHIEGLKFAGIDVISLANNHAANEGQEGVIETRSLLTNNGFTVVGVPADPSILEVNGLKVAFLGFNEVNIQPGVNAAHFELVQQLIQKAAEQADVVVVQFHWGNEYTRQPSKNQQALAKLAAESGATLVVGNHPHWWQPEEWIGETLVVYSHGNFIFDQMWSIETREGLVGRYTFEGNRLVEHEFLPVRIENYGQPHWLEGEEKKRILDEFSATTFTRYGGVNDPTEQKPQE